MKLRYATHLLPAVLGTMVYYYCISSTPLITTVIFLGHSVLHSLLYTYPPWNELLLLPFQLPLPFIQGHAILSFPKIPLDTLLHALLLKLRLPCSFFLPRCLGLLLSLLKQPNDIFSLRQELACSLLIQLIIWIFARGDELSEPCGSLEEEEIADGACEGPVEENIGVPAAPLVERYPYSLLGSEVGVTRVRPESSCDESPVKVDGLVA